MWQNSKPYWLILPAVMVIMVLFFGGLIVGLVQSFGYFPAVGQFSFSISAYYKLLTSIDFWLALWLTIRISFVSTLLAGILGIGISAFFIKNQHRKSRLSRSLQGLFNLPLLIPHFVGAYIMMLLFMQSGWVSRLCYALGIIQHPKAFPVLTNDPTGWGIILTYAWKEAPFIALIIYPVLRKVYAEWQEVAKVFGATSWRFFIEVTLPLLVPSWLSSCFIVFAFTFSAFEVPYLMGITFPQMLSVLSYNIYTNGGWNRMPEAMAINVILIIIIVILGIIAYKLSRKGNAWEEPLR